MIRWQGSSFTQITEKFSKQYEIVGINDAIQEFNQ